MLFRSGYVVANVRDITDRKEADAELARLALIDEMTGLPNRLALLELIREGLAERAGDRSTSCGVVFFDIDDFCDVNDSLGHGIGDALLVAMADRLAALMPEGCTLARFGDDQFAVFCRDVDTDAAMAVACLVQRGLEEPFLVDVHEVFVVVSVGVALTPPGVQPISWAYIALSAIYLPVVAWVWRQQSARMPALAAS